MPETPSQPAGPTLQPFRLLDLPRELVVQIVRSYRSPILERDHGFFIYRGEIGEGRYRVLGRLCLTHRDILPFAQEELFKRLDIRNDETMDLLNQSIASSGRCKEYAERAESFFLGEDVDPDGLMESGVFNPCELTSNIAMELSLLNRFQNLRRIHLESARLDEPLMLPNLESYSMDYLLGTRIDAHTTFQSVNLPNLRRLHISHNHYDEKYIDKSYISVVPQLNHLHLWWLCVADVEHLLLLSTALQSLSIEYGNYNEGASKVLNQISRLDVEELRFSPMIAHESSDNWETDFELMEKCKKVIKGKDGLKRVELSFVFNYFERPSDDVCDQALARWKAIKGELELTCVKEGTEVLGLTCRLIHGHDDIWEA